MRSTRILIAVAAVASLLASGCGRGGETGAGGDPGITDREIVLGGSYPYSGPASAYGTVGRAAQAYFAYVNKEKGGVKMADGKTRKIKFISYDDGYDPAQQLANARKLIERDKVFALFNMLGTPTHLAAVDYINEQKTPDLFLNSVSAIWSKNASKYPWTTGWQPSNEIEGAIFAEAVKKRTPKATVAILYTNDEAGQGEATAFEEGIAGSGVKVVAKQSYEVSDPTVDSQVTKLATSKADVLINIANPKAAAQAIRKVHKIGWKTDQYLFSPSSSIRAVLKPAGLKASTGIHSVEWLKDPSDPKWADDPAIKEYKRVLTTYGKNVDPEDRLNVNGVAAAQTIIGTLKRLKEPNREALMDLVRNIDPPVQVPMLLPGLDVSTGPGEYLPIKAMQLQTFNGRFWELHGSLIDPSKQ